MIEDYPNAAQNRDVFGEAGDPVAKWFRAGVDCQTAGRFGAMRCQSDAAATQQGGAILLNLGLSSDATGGSIVVALSSCYPVLTTVMAYFLFKEKIPLLALAGGSLAIAGIVVLSI